MQHRGELPERKVRERRLGAGTGPVYYGVPLYKVGGSCYKDASIPTTSREPIMERRILGKTGVEVAVLGFGCGAVGGLMVRGTAADQERAVARALALGINYFDTAPSTATASRRRTSAASSRPSGRTSLSAPRSASRTKRAAAPRRR